MYASVETTALLGPARARARSSVPRVAGALLCVTALAAVAVALTFTSNTRGFSSKSSTSLATSSKLGFGFNEIIAGSSSQSSTALATSAKLGMLGFSYAGWDPRWGPPAPPPSAEEVRQELKNHVETFWYNQRTTEDLLQEDLKSEQRNAELLATAKEAELRRFWSAQHYCKKSYRYFKFEILDLRDESGYKDGDFNPYHSSRARSLLGGNLRPSLEFADVILYDVNGKVPVDLAKSTNPRGQHPEGEVTPLPIPSTTTYTLQPTPYTQYEYPYPFALKPRLRVRPHAERLARGFIFGNLEEKCFHTSQTAKTFSSFILGWFEV